MKAMLLSDFAILEKRLMHHAKLIAIAVVALLVMVNTPLVVLFVGLPEALAAVAQLTKDEDGKHGWEKLRAALPLSRTEIVIGRYLTVALVAVTSIVLADVLVVLVSLLYSALPAIGLPLLYFVELDLLQVALWTCVGIALALFVAGLLLPFVLMKGYTGAIPTATAALMALVMVAFWALGSRGAQFFSLGGLSFDATAPQIVLLSLGMLALGAAWYAASAALATRLYAKREL